MNSGLWTSSNGWSQAMTHSMTSCSNISWSHGPCHKIISCKQWKAKCCQKRFHLQLRELADLRMPFWCSPMIFWAFAGIHHQLLVLRRPYQSPYVLGAHRDPWGWYKVGTLASHGHAGLFIRTDKILWEISSDKGKKTYHWDYFSLTFWWCKFCEHHDGSSNGHCHHLLGYHWIHLRWFRRINK